MREMMRLMEFRLKLRRLTSLMIGSIGLCAAFGIASTATAVTSEALLMVDGSGDGFVDIVALNIDADQDFNFGYYDGGFHQILSATSIMANDTFNDGDVVDFAIQSVSDAMVYKLSDGNADITFEDGSTSASILWAVDNTNVITTLSAGDTFALGGGAAPMPEPSAALVFGLGLVVASWRVRRQSTD
jgi:hypothetical protein